MSTSHPIRILHFADTHFGVETHGRLDPATGVSTRLLDFQRSVEHLIDLALQQGIHAALFAGDAYKNRDPSQTHQRAFGACIARLVRAGIPVIMIPGNHDRPNMRGKAHAMEIWPTLEVSGVQVLSKPEVVVVQTSAGPLQVCSLPTILKGIAAAREEVQRLSTEEIKRHIEQAYIDHIERLAQTAHPDIPTVLLGHFWVGGARLNEWQQGYFHTGEAQVEVTRLARRPFDYVALGHIHRFQNLREGLQPPVVYCGSPDRVDFGERSDVKGAVIADVSPGHTELQFLENTLARPFLDITVDADALQPTESVLSALESYALQGAIARVTVRITQSAAASLRDREIANLLSQQCAHHALRRQLLRDDTASTRGMDGSQGPLQALEVYLREKKKRQPDAERLQLMAAALLAEQASAENADG
jgi:exonuclease SbcD